MRRRGSVQRSMPMVTSYEREMKMLQLLEKAKLLASLATKLGAADDLLSPWRVRLRQDENLVWILTLRLEPYGRASSTEADWKLSGQILGAISHVLGYEPTAYPNPIEDIATTHPNEALHWIFPIGSKSSIRYTNGPVNTLPSGWTSKPFSRNGVCGTQYDSLNGIRVIVTDEPLVGKSTRHISASHSQNKINQAQVELIRCIFAFSDQETMLDSINPTSGVWHLWQTKPDEFATSCRY